MGDQGCSLDLRMIELSSVCVCVCSPSIWSLASAQDVLGAEVMFTRRIGKRMT